MSELDKKIREALRAEDANWFDENKDEPSLLAQSLETIRGRHKWMVMVSITMSLIFTALSVYAIVQFLDAEEVREMMIWGAVAFFGFMAVTALKLWFWLELNKNAVTREVKRVELQLAHLSARIEEMDARRRSEG